MHIEIHHFHHFDCDKPYELKSLLQEVLTTVTQNQTLLKDIKMSDDEVSALLDQVNATTNGIAAIVTADSTTLGNVKTELEALLAQPTTVSGLSDVTSAKLQSFVATLGNLKTNAGANSDLLAAIAAEGKPVIPPPPPPPPAV